MQHLRTRFVPYDLKNNIIRINKKVQPNGWTFHISYLYLEKEKRYDSRTIRVLA
jgi:hypothetical protein